MGTNKARVREHVMKLTDPVKHDGTTIHEVRMRRAKGRDMRVLEEIDRSANRTEAAMKIVAQLCDIPLEVVDEMDADDVTALMEYVEDFLPNGAVRQAGGGSSQTAPTG